MSLFGLNAVSFSTLEWICVVVAVLNLIFILVNVIVFCNDRKRRKRELMLKKRDKYVAKLVRIENELALPLEERYHGQIVYMNAPASFAASAVPAQAEQPAAAVDAPEDNTACSVSEEAPQEFAAETVEPESAEEIAETNEAQEDTVEAVENVEETDETSEEAPQEFAAEAVESESTEEIDEASDNLDAFEEIVATESEEEKETVVNSYGGSGIRYNRSFTAKLIQSEYAVKEWYSTIKNELLSYKKVHDRMSWKRESFRRGRRCVARMAMRGRTLCLYLALNAEDYAETKYRVESAAAGKANADTPCMYRIRSARRAKYAKDLIRDLMSGLGVERLERENENYIAEGESTENLIRRGLIKVIGGEGLAEQEPVVADPIEEIAVATEKESNSEELLEEIQEDISEENSSVEEKEEVAAICEDDEIETVQDNYLYGGGGIRYNRSFTAKLIQSEYAVKEWYSVIKNEILSYEKVRDRMSWKRESFRRGRKCVARITMRGRTLCLYLALDASDYANTKYRVESAAAGRANADTPCMFRIKSARRVKYAKDLIRDVMAKFELAQTGRESVNYVTDSDTTENLIRLGLIKVTGAENNAAFEFGTEHAEVVAEPETTVEDIVAEEPAVEEAPAETETVEEEQTETPVEEAEEAIEETETEEVVAELETTVEDIVAEEPAVEEAPAETVEEEQTEAPVEEAEEAIEETETEEVVAEPETTVEDIVAEEPAVEEAPVETETVEEEQTETPSRLYLLCALSDVMSTT